MPRVVRGLGTVTSSVRTRMIRPKVSYPPKSPFRPSRTTTVDDKYTGKVRHLACVRTTYARTTRTRQTLSHRYRPLSLAYFDCPYTATSSMALSRAIRDILVIKFPSLISAFLIWTTRSLRLSPLVSPRFISINPCFYIAPVALFSR